MYAFWNSVLRPALDALRPSHVVEVGAADGLVTKPLAAYCSERGARLTSIDIFPRFDVSAVQKEHPHFQLSTRPSLSILPTLDAVDVVLLDGDHNWYTVHEELKTLWKNAPSAEQFPVTFVHDIGWPYGHRDLYYVPNTIPPDMRQPYAVGGVVAGYAGLKKDAGLNLTLFHAQTEGGERNGVATAVDDFLRENAASIGVVRVPCFHGLAILFPLSLRENNKAFDSFLMALDRTSAMEVILEDVERDRMVQHTRVYQLRWALSANQLRRWQIEKDMLIMKKKIRHLNDAVHDMEVSRSWRWTVWLRHMSLRTLLSPARLRMAALHQWQALQTLKRPASENAHAPVTHGHVTPHDTSLYPEDVVRRFHAGASSLSVIVTARNNGLFLKECLESVVHQTVQPMEVIYCDDGSADNSVAIASSVRGVTVLARKHEGVVKARNAAVASSTGNLLLHVDGDDLLPPSYIATHLEKLSWHPDAAFSYGGRHSFGIETSDFIPIEWNTKELWKENYINTSFVVRREAFLAAGGWRETVHTLWDWDLLLRLSRIGHGIRCDAVLWYRIHAGGWSQMNRQMDLGDTGMLLGRVRRAAARISICCVYGGRLPELFSLWMDALAASVQAYPETIERPEFVMLDNSDGVTERVKMWEKEHPDVFRCITVLPHRQKISWSSEMERRHKVSMFLAQACNKLLVATDGEIVWFVEEDVVVPEHAYGALLHGLTDGMDPPGAVSGLYRNRHCDDWVAHRVDRHGNVLPVDISEGEEMQVDLVGTGCLMFLRPFAPYTFDSHWRGNAQAHDWNWCEKVRVGDKRILLYPSIRCRHYSDKSTWV